MDIKILGCYGNIIGKYRATSFLINNALLLDAGTTTEVLDDRQLGQIKNVVISHTHIDHVKGIFPLIDELVTMNKKGITLSSTGQALDIISKNLFNNLIWPDFTAIPSINNAVVKFNEIELEKETRFGEITIKPILVTHTVYTTGFVIREGSRGFMFTADTGPTKRFWEAAKQEKGVELIIADVSFPNRLGDLAKSSGHMTPSTLIEHIDRFGLGSMPVYINHIKPIFLNEITDELRLSGRKNIKPLRQGTVFNL